MTEQQPPVQGEPESVAGTPPSEVPAPGEAPTVAQTPGRDPETLPAGQDAGTRSPFARPIDPLPGGQSPALEPPLPSGQDAPTETRSPFTPPSDALPVGQGQPQNTTAQLPYAPPGSVPSGQFPAQSPYGPPAPAVAYSNEPVPGQQFPAAVLPGTDYDQHPGGPFPVPHSEPFPVQQPPPMYVPRKPRNKPVLVLSIAAVFFFLSTAALGTLWLIEKGDHKSTANELSSTQNSLTKTNDDLKSAEGREQAANVERQKTLKDIQAMQPCFNAAKAFLRASTEADANKAFDELIDAC